jgi:heme-degrading monooxygenase HmoA
MTPRRGAHGQRLRFFKILLVGCGRSGDYRAVPALRKYQMPRGRAAGVVKVAAGFRRGIMMAFIAAWEFLVRAGKEQRFEEIYGPEGAWAQLFRQGDGYVRTELQRDAENPRHYLTLDFWQSRRAYDLFRAEHQAEYQILDAECGELTEKETEIGYFEPV